MIDLPAGLVDAAGVVGVGIDLVEIERIERAIARTSGFAERVFAASELEACADRPDRAAALAGRFAAKEAALKALALGIFDLRLTEIVVDGGGDRPPSLVLHGAARSAGDERGVGGWLLSTTHDGGMAAAVAVALGRPHPAER